ncbi:SyrP-like protein [Streptomyces globisporus]|uniref:SyrP-like protein n=1 Tax=Streptomyces globisporus TaxID=1908 RepID=A0ABM9H9M4_STRGL|nr:TauD/TfdA family dioxygenase [Streptomyces globisporus]CAH9420385.1 SyrP-like protein [Streptomyces globisporus]
MSEPSDWTPHVVTPDTAGVTANHEGLLAAIGDTARTGELLLAKKALVFRGFGTAKEQVDSALDLLLPNRLAYVHGNSPRTKVGSNIYTSTEYPAEFTISMHNELSYARRWPSRLAFYCERQPTTEGATPVVDGTLWLSSLDDEVRAAFSKGIRYTQNLHSGAGFGRSWQDTFETSDKDEVEAHLADADVTWEWKTDGGIRLTQLRPATVRHPVTGDEVWFNQFDQWHLAGLDADTAAMLTELMPEDELPQSVTFADGTPIPDAYVAHVRDNGLAAAVDVNWYAGDLLLIDNVAVAHGRRPYTGPRRVLVAMSG